jgi:ribonuclease HIII
MTSHTAALTTDQAMRLRELLAGRGFEFGDKPHALFHARKAGLSVTVYQKGPKVLVQGRDTGDFVRFTLEPEILGEARLGYEEVHQPRMFEPHFGVDESGKGDYFGPLVVAGVWVDAALARRFLDAGVTDSKKIAGSTRVRRLAAEIRNAPGVATAVVVIGPERYNSLYQEFRNLNQLLAWGHVRVIEQLAAARPDCRRALSDQFARRQVLVEALRRKGLTLELEQRHRAEDDVAVAAASILARERFLGWLEKASQAGGVALPPGVSATVVEAAREIVRRHGPDMLGKVAKLHFKTSAAVLGPPPANGA